VTGTLFFVPPATFFENVVTAEAAPSGAGPTGTGFAPGSRSPLPDGSLGIGSLKSYKAGHE
jgi:putative iron-dependent peroxidase